MKNTALTALVPLLMTHQALALGLGEPAAASYLGEPLSTRILVIDSENWADDQLRVSVLGDSAAAIRNIDARITHSGGRRFVTLTSTTPQREPFIAFTVELRWPQGTLQRQYQLLLDPAPKP